MKPNKIAVILILTGLMSCSIFVETNLSKKVINLTAPANGSVSYTRTQTFWWTPLEDADGYNLQIVSPRFKAVNRLVADSNVTTNKLNYTLSPGKYEWTIRAYNSSSELKTDTFSFTVIVDSSNDLSKQIVILNSPDNNSNRNDSLINFGWDKIDGATQYQIQIKKDSWDGGQIIESELTTDNTMNLVLTEGSYVWGVRASDDLTMTQYSTRTLILDLTPPSAPIITVPARNGDTLDVSPYLIKWSHPTASLSAISDSIFIAKDSLFTDPVIYSTSLLEQSISDLVSNKYFLKIRSFDAAGNNGKYSAVRKFFLQINK
jgi:hypothetical protein